MGTVLIHQSMGILFFREKDSIFFTKSPSIRLWKRENCDSRGIKDELRGIPGKTRGIIAGFRGITQSSRGITTEIGGIKQRLLIRDILQQPGFRQKQKEIKDVLLWLKD